MPWTPQQQDAINSINRSVIVSASAGSGKTAVLVERVINQIINEENHIPADKIIIVTFTNDASAELRQRLNLRLQKEISKSSDSRFLLQQYTLFQNAKISTIDSFCFDIIRNNAENLDITSGFTVLEGTKADVMKNQAINDTLELWSRSKPEKYNILYDRFCLKDDSGIKNIILETDKFLESIPDREEWLENTEKELKKTDFKNSVYGNLLSEYSKNQLDSALELALQNQSLILNELKFSLDSKAFTAISNQCQDDIDIIKNCIRNNSVPSDKFKTLVRGIKTICPEYDKNRSKFKDIIKAYSENISCIDEDMKDIRDVFSVLHEILLDFYQIFWEAKCQKNSISFDDGEKIVIKMLSDTDENGNIVQSQLARELSEKYQIIMIDEYQDSNDKQDRIFKLLSKNYVPEKNMYGDNVFLVGDVKQSIYRFRLANPDNFINTLKNSVPYSKDLNDSNVSVFLNKNFRSSPEVINYVNYVFFNVMSEKCGDVEYDDSEKLYFGAENEYPYPDSERKPEIIIINQNTEENQNNDYYEESDVTPESECIAEKIADMIKSGYEVNLPDNKKRPCEPKDFCILARQTKCSSAFIESLKKRGIYARGEEQTGYLKSREIAILLDILRIIDNPLNDIPAIAVMMSPMFMFTSQEVAEIRVSDKNISVYLNVQNICENQYNVSENLKQKCIKFRDVVRDFRTYSVIHSIEELIEEIYDSTDFLSIMQQFVDGERKKANLRMLIQYARGYDENANIENGGNLSGFLRYIDNIQSGNYDLPHGKISAVSENFVAVKTIHKSKGLEYPFIFLVKTDIEFIPDNKMNIICSPENAVGFKLNYPETMTKIKTFPFEALYISNKEKKASEELRLLYVALTRAKQKLFVSLPLSDKYLNTLKNLSENLRKNNYDTKKTACLANSLGEWIWLTLLVHEKFSDIKQEICPELETNPLFCDDLFSISYFSESDIEHSVTDEIIKNADFAVKPETLENLRNIMKFSYDLSRSEIPSKMTVTQLISDEPEAEGVTLKVPQFMIEESQPATERGNAIHKFLQYCNFWSDADDTEDEIQSMIDRNYFTESEAELIPKELIKKFFKSKLCERIKSAVSFERERSFEIQANELKYKNSEKSDFLNSDGMIIGVIDLLIHEPDGIVIVDYKSNRNTSEYYLRKKYSAQLEIYKSAVEKIYQKPVKETLIYSTELAKTISI